MNILQRVGERPADAVFEFNFQRWKFTFACNFLRSTLGESAP